MVYGYARISTPKQKITRQIQNIKDLYPDAIIYEEVYTGAKFQGREKLEKLLKKVKPGDTICFDEVSRMSRNAEEGYKLYKDLFLLNINLIFIKEPQVNTDVYKNALNTYIEKTGTPADILIEAIEKFMLALAEEQIKLAFERSEQELKLLRKRTCDGLEVARSEGKVLGRKKGSKIVTEKAKAAKKIILQHSKKFGGNLKMKDVLKLAGISATQYYIYVKEIEEERNELL